MRTEKVPCVEIAVPQELIHGAMEIVASGFGRNQNLTAGIAPIFGVINARQHLELLDSIYRRTIRRLHRRAIGIVHAIKQVVVGDLLMPRNIKSSPETDRRVLRRRKNVRDKL
jgi:hypothetical protein